MNKQLDELKKRRLELLATIAAQRILVADEVTFLEPRLVWVDKGWRAVSFLRSSPMFLAGVAAFLLFRRRGAIGLVRGAWSVWKKYRTFASPASRSG